MNARKSVALVGGLASFFATSCDESNREVGDTRTPQAAPDNTARNKVDQDLSTKTPMDQSQSAADVTIVAEIRKAILSDSGMSVNAQNCKVVVQSGAVTLRGVVETQAEKESIGNKAKAVAGVTSVDNQLEVKPN
jgi:hyperosmotically inducible periplasmic protein